MKKLASIFILCILFLTTCAPQVQPASLENTPDNLDSAQEENANEETPSEKQPSDLQGTSATIFNRLEIELPEMRGKNLSNNQTAVMAGAGLCIACHTNLKDEAGNDISMDVLWRPGMMANAARDPYWLATVSAEVTLQPELKEVIEDKCATCHMPMARVSAQAAGTATYILRDGFNDPGNELHELAIEGISCNLCHQIEAGNFNQVESFSGGYKIDLSTPKGERPSYGPFPVTSAATMQGASGYIPIESTHIQNSALCGTCHNLHTPFLDASGEIIGEFPEQMIYSEWQNSQYGNTQTCNSCHMPHAEGAAMLSILSTNPQSPIAQHSFVGANAFMVYMLAMNGDQMQVTASTEQFAAEIERITTHLSAQTTRVQIKNVEINENQISATVVIDSLVGHKFPTGFPSRRAWLYFSVTDASGNVIFESGAADPSGAIQGNDNDYNASIYEPHYQTISTPEQVQIYEVILQNTDNEVTTTLLRASGYLKDNRILPLGLDKENAPVDIAVHGTAFEDQDFNAGSDSVDYVIKLEEVNKPYTIIVQLLYQPIGFRWADHFRDIDTLEARQFIQFYDALSNLPFLVGEDTFVLGK
jgi:mono/diheme cytochrome c family protein